MGRACSMTGEKIKHIGYTWKGQKEKDLYVHESIILKWILE
jgi:hypothetical protein